VEFFSRISKNAQAQWTYGEKFGRAQSQIEFSTNITKIGNYALHCRHQQQQQQKEDENALAIPATALNIVEPEVDPEENFLASLRRYTTAACNNIKFPKFLGCILLAIATILFFYGTVISGTRKDLQLIAVNKFVSVVPECIKSAFDSWISSPWSSMQNFIRRHTITFYVKEPPCE